MAGRCETSNLIELLAVQVTEIIEEAHGVAATALPADLSLYRKSAQRLARSGQDISTLALAMEVVIKRS